MDFSAASKPLAASSAQTTVRTDIAVQNGAAPVELPPEQTVRSVAAGDPVQLDIRARSQERRQDARQQGVRDDAARRRLDAQGRSDERDEAIDQQLDIDEKTRSVILRKTNRDTGEVVEQLPDETLLKLRVWSREILERSRDADAARDPEVERIA